MCYTLPDFFDKKWQDRPYVLWKSARKGLILLYLIGFYDEDLEEDGMIEPPVFGCRSSVKLGKYYSQEVVYNGETIKIKIKYELVNGITVPYGTYNDVIKLTQKITRRGKVVMWFAKNIGKIKETDDSSKRIENLQDITDVSSRPRD